MKIFQAEQPFFQKPKIKGRLPEYIVLSIIIIVHFVLLYSVVRSANPIIWPLHNDTIHRYGRASDFNAIYHAGVNMKLDVSPYELNDDGITPYFYRFRYLPFVSVVAQLFTLTTPYRAYFLWAMFLELLLAALAYLVWTRMDQRIFRMITMSVLLVNSPFFLELYMGQFTFATTALCFLALFLPAGIVFFTISLLLKPITLAVVPAFARKKSTLIICILAGFLLLLLNAPIFLSHPDFWEKFYLLNFAMEGGVGFHSGNYGFVYFLWQVANDLSLHGLLDHWVSLFGVIRLILLALMALIVLHSKVSMRTGIAALLLTHFITYLDVWEHHLSAVILIGVILMTVPALQKKQLPILCCLVILALPTPFVFFDIAKDAAVFDPTLTWPRYAIYLVLLPKVIPTITLFALTTHHIFSSGFVSTREVFRAIFSKESEHTVGVQV